MIHNFGPTWRQVRPIVRILVYAGSAAAFLAIFVWALPVWLTMHPKVTGPDRLTAINNARIGIASVLAVLGTIGGFAYTIRTYRLSRQGQIADRYTKAIDQLASSNSDIRVGGLFALDQTARDAVEYRSTVVEVLVAYIRSHARWPNPISRPRTLSANSSGNIPPDQDIRIALELLRPLIRDTEKTSLDLRNTDLGGANLRWMFLVDCRLNNANLTDTDLGDANLRGADLRGACLQGALFHGSNLTDATLWKHQINLEQIAYAKGTDSIQWLDPKKRADLFPRPSSSRTRRRTN